MPRNVSGTYTLPLPPVVPNTTIESDWANDTLADLAQAMTDSTDRYGRGGLTAPLRLVDGTVLQPAWAFSAETGTGMYRAGAGQMGLSIMGTLVAGWDTNGYTGKLANVDITALGTVDGNPTFTGNPVFAGNPVFNGSPLFLGSPTFGGTVDFTGPLNAALLRLDDGTVAAPSLAFKNQTDLGLSRSAANTVRWTSNGKAVAELVALDAGGSGTAWVLFPRSTGRDSGISLYREPAGVASGTVLQISNNASGAFIQNAGYGGATSGDINYGAANHRFTGANVFMPRWSLTSGAFVVSEDATNVYQLMVPSSYWNFHKPSGDLGWNQTGGTTVFKANGDFVARGNVYAGASMALIDSGNDRSLRLTADNWRWVWNNGVLYYQAPGGTTMNSFAGDGTIYSKAGRLNLGDLGSFLSTKELFLVDTYYDGAYYSTWLRASPQGYAQYISFWHRPGVSAGIDFMLGGNQRFQFDGAGVALKASGAGQWNGLSDIRLKENVKPLAYGLAEILRLEPITFHWKERAQYSDGTPFVGLSAQAVEPVMPLATYKGEDRERPELGDVLGLKPDFVQYALVNAVKELAARLTAAGF